MPYRAFYIFLVLVILFIVYELIFVAVFVVVVVVVVLKQKMSVESIQNNKFITELQVETQCYAMR